LPDTGTGGAARLCAGLLGKLTRLVAIWRAEVSLSEDSVF